MNSGHDISYDFTVKVCLRIVFFPALLIAVFSMNSFAQATFSQQADHLLNYLSVNNSFSGNISIARGEQMIYQRDFNVNSELNNEYCIGSVTKVFTATIIYQLVAENKLSLDDKLGKFFPELPNSGNITILQMLGHQSGIADIVNDPHYDEFKEADLSRDELLRRIAMFKPAFRPGKKTAYSNSNYILLGFIIEDVTQQPFSDVLKQRIMIPLNLKNTYLPVSSDTMGRNPCYYFTGNGWKKVERETNSSISFAAGGVVSSAEDLNKFAYALFSGKLIDNNMLSVMESHADASLCHGIMFAPFYEHNGYGHTGHIDEFYTELIYLPGDSLSIAFCTNGLNYDLNEICTDLLSMYYHKEFDFPLVEKIKIPDDSLQKFAGTYRLKLFRILPVTRIEITSENDALFTTDLRVAASTRTILEPVDKNRFKNFQYDSELTFSFKKDGSVKGCAVVSGKTKMYCRKLD